MELWQWAIVVAMAVIVIAFLSTADDKLDDLLKLAVYAGSDCETERSAEFFTGSMIGYYEASGGMMLPEGTPADDALWEKAVEYADRVTLARYPQWDDGEKSRLH